MLKSKILFKFMSIELKLNNINYKSNNLKIILK